MGWGGDRCWNKPRSLTSTLFDGLGDIRSKCRQKASNPGAKKQIPEPRHGIGGSTHLAFRQGVFRCGALSTSSSSAGTEQGLGQSPSLYRENTASRAVCPHQTSMEGGSITILPALFSLYFVNSTVFTHHTCAAQIRYFYPFVQLYLYLYLPAAKPREGRHKPDVSRKPLR